MLSIRAHAPSTEDPSSTGVRDNVGTAIAGDSVSESLVAEAIKQTIVDFSQFGRRRTTLEFDVAYVPTWLGADEWRAGLTRERRVGMCSAVVVLDFDDPDELTLQRLRQVHGIHELAIEDALEPHHQRPKLERFGPMWFLVLKTVSYDDAAEAIDFGEMLVMVGRSYVITVRHGRACRLPPSLEMLVNEQQTSAMSVLHGIVDYVTDEYGPVMDDVERDLVEIETDVFSPERTNPARRIYRLKREVLALRRNVAPLVSALTTLADDVEGEVPEELRSYFRDAEDHVRRMVDRIRQANVLLSEVLDANLAQISVQQNADMRRMTAWAVLFLVPTLLAGVWGMNFSHMPELGWKAGYPLAVGSMVATTGYFWWRLRRAGWL